MKKDLFTLIVASLSLILLNCSENPEPPKENEGILQFGFRMPGEIGFKRTDSNTCKLLDVGAQMQYFGVGQMVLQDGAASVDYKWQPLFIYNTPEDLDFSYYKDRKSVTVQLEAGFYSSTKMIQNTNVAWLLETPKGDTILAITPNTTNCPQSKDSRGFFSEYYDSIGMYTEENGILNRCRDGGSEGMGGFEIRPDKKTQVIMRNNIASIDWIDVDNSGDWSEGDELDNWETYNGTPLMVRYEIKYLE